jgi:hypothetical protein
MKRLLGIFALLALSAAPTMAQEARFELSAGGSFRVFQQTETPSSSRIGMPGWYFSGVYNLHRFWNRFGFQLEGTGAYRDQGTFGNTSIYSLQAGPRFYPFGHHKLTPYGEVLLGQAYYMNQIPAYGGYSSSHYSYTAFSWEGGVGMELNLRKHWGVRVLQVDYAQTNFFSYGVRQNNYRASVGIIYRFDRVRF